MPFKDIIDVGKLVMIRYSYVNSILSGLDIVGFEC